MANGPAATETRHLRTLFALGATGMLTDGQLLERFATLKGDPAELAFAALVERHGPMVLRVARSALLDEHAAHDAFQATFLILARKGRSLWVRDSLAPWLLAVARRVASQSRAAEARRRVVEQDAARPESQQPGDWSRSDLLRAIHQEIDRLPHPYRLAVVTCHLEGLTQHEAAARLGWPVGTLQSRLARGRQRLRDRLQRRGLAPSLGVLAGKAAPVPNALTASTAKAALTLFLGGKSADWIAPSILALMETTTKGMFMTKLKLGAVALLMTCGIVGSGVAVGVGRPVRATDETPSMTKIEIPEPASLVEPRPVNDTGKSAEEDRSRDLSLLYFYAPWEANSRKMTPVIQEMARTGYPIRSIDVGRSDGLSDRYGVDFVPACLVVDEAGNALLKVTGVIPPEQISGLFDSARAMIRAGTAPPPAEPAPSASRVAEPREAPTPEPPLEVPPAPRPWETVVRVKVQFNEKEWGFGSGAVIQSTADGTLILTAAHHFRDRPGGPQVEAARFSLPIRVDLFDGKLTGQQPAKVGPAETDLPGQLIDRDDAHDLALVSIRPGRVVPAARVARPDGLPSVGTRLYSLGCSYGNDATAWTTVVLDPSVPMLAPVARKSFTTIKCTNQPAEGRSGGGLYTSDGDLMGICLFAEPNEKVGLYAPPSAIRVLIERNGLASVHDHDPFRVELNAPLGHEPFQVPLPAPGLSQPVPDPNFKPGQIRRNSPAPNSEPPASRAVSDQQRLDDLERKLNRVLQALEEMKAGDSPRKR